jgi:magnesium-transporting ATPase (P-type)
MAYKMGFDYKKFRNRDKIKKIFPFSSEKKKIATVYEDEKGKLYVFVKGAPDFLLSYCSQYVNSDGSTSKMSNNFSQKLL